MIRYQIFEGDVTTAGGVVQKHTQGASTFTWHGRLASNIGDKINCPACGSVGYIQAAGMRRPFDNMNHVPALNDDLYICKCNPPPKLKHSQTTCNQNVEGGIIWDNSKTTIKKTINSYFPNSQQNLNNSLVEDKGESYYKWHWGASAYTNPKTNEQQNKSFLVNFNDLHNEFAHGKVRITYEVDPKAWDTEVAFEQLLSIIKASAESTKNTLGHMLSTLKEGQSEDLIWVRVGVGGEYVRIAQSKHWPFGRLSTTLYGVVTNLGTDANGKKDFRFKGYAKISNDLYSWYEDATGYRKALIKTAGTAVAILKGTKEPAPVYNTGNPKTSGLPITYTRYYHFDYYKKGTKHPKYKG